MGLSTCFGRRAFGAVALLISLAFAGMAQAVPIYTYTFTLTGFTAAGPVPGTVTGSFSGALDSGGHITRNTLTAYHFDSSGFDGSLGAYNWSDNNLPYLFSYIPEDTGSFALVAYSSLNFQSTICIGSPVSFLCNGGSGRGAAALNSFGQGIPFVAFLAATTDSLPVLIGSVSDVGDPVFLAATPIPAPLALFATGLGALSVLTVLRRRRDRSAGIA
jgi:hypothetical protein